ncbi:MAG: AAA family ATPase [Oligoflexia bacterium]|nr:AAA family ATPase [Oligoflexia bacterium]
MNFPLRKKTDNKSTLTSSSLPLPLPKVIAIMGISGAGKTALAKSLSKALNVTAIFWDDFDPISSGPDDLVMWYKQSRNFNDWKYDELARVLKMLKDGQDVSCPLTGKGLVPTKYIIFDAPLGRRHTATAIYIDQLVLIDTPLDIALARRLLREKNSDLMHGSIYDELNYYLEHSRPLFIIDDECRKQCDLVLNVETSATSIDELTNKVISWLNCL